MARAYSARQPCARMDAPGEVAEWLKATVLKTVRPARVSGVRIPPSPLMSGADAVDDGHQRTTGEDSKGMPVAIPRPVSPSTAKAERRVASLRARRIPPSPH
jgi:hypothetical protein